MCLSHFVEDDGARNKSEKQTCFGWREISNLTSQFEIPTTLNILKIFCNSKGREREEKQNSVATSSKSISPMNLHLLRKDKALRYKLQMMGVPSICPVNVFILR